MRLEDPHRPLRAIDGRRPLALVAVLLALLPGPRARLVVVLPDAVIEVAREAADHRLVAGVGEAKPAAREPAEMLVRADDHDGLPHALRLDRRDHAGGGAAVDHEVEFGGRGLCAGEREEDEEQGEGAVHGSGFRVGSGVRSLGSGFEQDFQRASCFSEG